MVIPLSGTADVPADDLQTASAEAGGWITLAPEAKCERLLTAAAQVFSTHGLEAAMSDVAEAAGAGVASVYRQFPSKRELLAALVIRRLDQIAAAAREAQEQPGDRWTALTDMLRALVSKQSADAFMGEIRAHVADHPDVQAASRRATAALDDLLDQARREGRLRSDATTLDLRLLFTATRAARAVEGEHWPRMLELLIDALDSAPRRR